MNHRFKSAKTVMRIFGIIGILIGISLLVSGWNQEQNAEMEDENWFEESSAGSMKMFAGFAVMGFSAMILFVSFIGKIASYQASETREAVSIIGDSAGSGISRGIRRGGGIKLDLGDSVPRTVQPPPRERASIKVRCRDCGYLESEDAAYCSKCGNRI